MHCFIVKFVKDVAHLIINKLSYLKTIGPVSSGGAVHLIITEDFTELSV